MKKIILVIATLPILFSISCKQEKTTIVFATSRNMWCTLSVIALEKNYFKDEGLDIRVEYKDAGKQCMEAVANNAAQFANVVDVNIARQAYTGDTNFAIVGQISGALTSAIVAKKSKGISTPLDLRGKTIAYSNGTTGDVFLRRFLKKYNIPFDSITPYFIAPKAITTKVAGTDGPPAASTWQPFITDISSALKDDAVVFEAPEIYTAREFIAVRGDWADKHKDEVLAFVKAIKKAEKFIKDNRSESETIVQRVTGMPIETIKQTWDKYYIALEDNKQLYIKDITQIGTELQEQDDYKGKPIPHYSGFFNNTYLNDVNK